MGTNVEVRRVWILLRSWFSSVIKANAGLDFHYDIESDLRSLGRPIRNWETKARNRNEWKAVVREAKVHFTGL